MRKKITLVFISFISFYAQSQNNGATIHVFQPNQENTTIATPAHLDSLRHIDKNCLKWNWSVLTRGVFLLNYETYLTGNLTLELGVGITYEDFLFEATYNSASGDFGSNSAYGSPKPGFCGEGGLRYYTSGYDNMEGVFLEATVSYRPYSFPNASFTPNTGTIVPGYDFLDYQFKFGYASSRWFSDFISEFYIGIGIRNATIKSYEEQSTSQYYVPQTTNASYPQPLLGFKIGYPF